MIHRLLSLFFLLPLAGVAAVNTTTPGVVTLLSTFQSISVRAKYSNDANGNNACAIGYRVSGTGAFIDAYTPIVDRNNTNAAFATEMRGSIVGLTANTAYEVQVTWSDSDGVVGTAISTNTVNTLSYVVPLGGSTTTVSDDAGLATALGSVNAGQTIHLNAGTYKPFTVSRSGNSGAYIKIEGDSGGGTIVQGTNINQNILEQASYVVLDHLTLGPSDHSGIVFGSGLTGLWAQNCTIQDVSVTCAVSPTSGNYGDAGIALGASCTNVFVLTNTILSPMLTTNSACTASPTYAGPGTGIAWTADTKTLVVAGNAVIGGFRDGISQDDSLVIMENVDVCGNVISGYKDDGAESKGANVNVRLWGNWITNTSGNTFIACNENVDTNPPGPLYIFRNRGGWMTGYAAANAYKFADYLAPAFIFHNTMDTSGGTGAIDAISDAGHIEYKNNITKSHGSIIAHGKTGDIFDYNDYLQTLASSFAYSWNGVTTYSALSDFQSGTSQETHGLANDPLVNGDLSIPANSPAKDAGVTLANFNDANSAWPAVGLPDIGAYEYQPPSAVLGGTGTGGGGTFGSWRTQ